jgi:CheY-like chemotaxis protein
MMRSEEPGKPVILVTDDEPFILQYIRHVLQLANYSVITATSVDEAWAILMGQPEIDLVLTDIVMPGSMDGLEFATKIHQLDRDLPVLFITGALSQTDARTTNITEGQVLLRKPFYPKQLVEFVGAQMRRETPGLAR